MRKTYRPSELGSDARPQRIEPRSLSVMDQQEVADIFKVCKSRISFMERRALRKMREAAKAEADAAGMTLREWLFGT